jgi:hypothetical protein
MQFDKGKPIIKEYCEFCKKEIKPGQKIVLTLTQPSKERTLFNRLTVEYYGYYDSASRYHENCFIKNIKKK